MLVLRSGCQLVDARLERITTPVNSLKTVQLWKSSYNREEKANPVHSRLTFHAFRWSNL